ncbi:reverse transcriptase domain-containing protein [Tanacetum coccineum]
MLVVRTKTPLYLPNSHSWRCTSNARQKPSEAAALSCLLCYKEKGPQQPLLGLLSAPNVLVRRPTLGLLILPSVLPFPPTIRRTARMSVLPIEPNLAERARISAINLDDHQLDPVTPPPSPSSPFLMAAYQRMIAETDPIQREEALTAYKLVRLNTILEDMERYPNACLEKLEAFMILWDVKPRVEESLLETLSVGKLITQLRQVCEDADDRASNAQEEARQKRKEAHNCPPKPSKGDRVKFASSTLQYGVLTLEDVYVRYVTLDTAHATPWSDFKAMFIRKYCPRNEIKQMENELWNLKVKGTNLTAYNQRFQELILLCPEMVPNTDRLLERYIEGLPLNIKGNVTSSKPVDLHEAIEMAQGLMYQVVQELGENFGDKKKWNGNHYNHNNTNHTSNLNPNKRPEAARVFIAGQGHKVKDCRAPPRPASQRGPGSQGGQGSDVTCFGCGEKGHYKNKCPNHGNQGGGNQIRGNPQNPQNNQRQNQGNPKGSNQASTSTQGGRRAPGRVYSLCAEAAVKDNNVVNELGSFDVIVEMDWMAEHHAEVMCYEKYIHVPYGNDMLTVQGERSGVKNKSRLEVISSIRTQKYINQGCQVFLIQMMKEEETEIPERRIEDVPVVRDFPEVFPEDLPGLPPTPKYKNFTSS